MLDLVWCVEALSAEFSVELFIGHLAIEQILVEAEELSVILQQLLGDLVAELGVHQLLVLSVLLPLVLAGDARDEEEILEADF